MIRRALDFIHHLRLRHAVAQVHLHGMACLAAQKRNDWNAAARSLGSKLRAEAKRDVLLGLRTATPACCNHNCREGRDCPFRAS